MGVPLYDLNTVELLKIKKNLKKSSQRKYTALALVFILYIILAFIGLQNSAIHSFFLVIVIVGLLWCLYLEKAFDAEIRSKHQITSGNSNVIIDQIFEAKNAEKAKNHEKAIFIWESLGVLSKAAGLRTVMNEQGAVKVSQKIVHGDEITKTDIKDSVVSKSSIGAGGKSKGEQIKEIKDLLDSGAIDDDEFKQMKKEILGK